MPLKRYYWSARSEFMPNAGLSAGYAHTGSVLNIPTLLGSKKTPGFLPDTRMKIV